MVDIASISAFIGSLNGLASLASAVTDLGKKIALMKQGASGGEEEKPDLRELGAQIDVAFQCTTAAKKDHAALLNITMQIKEKLREYERWDTEKSKYVLRNVADGYFVMERNPCIHSDGEPPHWACQPCFDQRKKRVLQGNTWIDASNETLQTWVCPTCRFSITTTQQSQTLGPFQDNTG